MNSYLIAVTLPKSHITEYIESLCVKYAKYSSYSIRPHITLLPPFLIIKGDLNSLKEKIASVLLLNNYRGFCLEILSVDYFLGENNVAFLKLSNLSIERLKNLFIVIDKGVGVFVENKYVDYKIEENNYHPHLTIAEKIPNEDLFSIQNELKQVKLNYIFALNSIDIYEQLENSKEWKVKEKICFV